MQKELPWIKHGFKDLNGELNWKHVKNSSKF